MPLLAELIDFLDRNGYRDFAPTEHEFRIGGASEVNVVKT
jgi:hypothetical protein